MTLHDLTTLLSDHAHLAFRLRLPGGAAIPQSFHITEVGHLHKTFLDCGGTLRESHTCQLQVWVGEDYQHRIETGKMASILAKASSILPDSSVPVEIEYEDQVISQYTLASHEILPDSVLLVLAHKHTECLAPELCGLPAFNRLPPIGAKSAPCCGPAGC
jgi:hypothetical protein